jgi:NADH-ubiquinone oxidoreductase chain 6
LPFSIKTKIALTNFNGVVEKIVITLRFLYQRVLKLRLNMQNFYIKLEIFSNGGFQPIALDILYLLSILSGIFVIISKNPVQSILFLISLFINISCYLVLTGMHFLGLSYLLVYVGGVSMLFLFVIMLINIRDSELKNNSTQNIPLGLLVSIAFYYPLLSVIPFSNSESLDSELGRIYIISSNKWDTAITQNTDIAAIGNIIYSSHAVWLILAGFILLLALVGAISITISPNSDTKRGG